MIMDPDVSITTSNEETKTSENEAPNEQSSTNNEKNETIVNPVEEAEGIAEVDIDNEIRCEETKSQTSEIKRLNKMPDVLEKPDAGSVISSTSTIKESVNQQTESEGCIIEVEAPKSNETMDKDTDIEKSSVAEKQDDSDSTNAAKDKEVKENVELSSIESGMTEMEISKDLEVNPQVNQESESDQQCTIVYEESQTKEKPVRKEDSDCIKSVPEKAVEEPEKTEFVQFSQDKNDDSQIETQCMDAEDPFGGDTLNLESNEPMETDDLTDTADGFSKLGDQADNLQNIISSRDSNFDANEANSEKQAETEKGIETVENIRPTTPVPSVSTGAEAHAEKPKAAESNSKDNNQTKTTTSENTPMDTEEEQSDVLPGQDDELCIIPDTMKLVVPDKTGENSSTKNISHEKDEEPTNTAQTDENEGSKEPIKVKEVSPKKNQNEDASEPTSTTNSEINQNDQISVEETTPSTATTVTNVTEEDKSQDVEEITPKVICKQCKILQPCKLRVNIGNESYSVCSKSCKALFKAANNRAMDIPSDGVNSKREKRCASCLLIIEPMDERNLSWETMEFCNEDCLGKFQTKYGSYCRNCNGLVQAVSLGKYCVRFGYDVRQFCCSSCLEEFKKGLKVCSYCQKDISSCADGFLAPVGDRGQFKDFCTQDCMEKYSKINSKEPAIKEKKCCSVCQVEKIVHCEVQLDRASPVAICGEPCFAAFKFVKKVDPDQCSTCKKFFELPNKKCFVVFFENEAHTFCSKTCLNVFITINRKIIPCNWCKVKKYNFDMIKKELKMGQILMMCSLNCLTLYQVSINAVTARRINCDFCKEFSQAQYHLTMSDATIRNFCCYNCVMKFQAQYTKSPITIPTSDDPVPTSGPKRTIPKTAGQPGQKVNEMQNKKSMPVISSVTSLAAMGNGQVSPTTQQNSVNNVIPQSGIPQNQAPQVIYKQQVITRPPSPVKVHNKMTQCKPLTHTKGVSVRPHPCTKSTQTDGEKQAVIPIPVPIYVPFPVHMYSMPLPIPVPIPLPIPVPIFIPTTRNSAKGILKDIKRIQEKIPADPFEAELLMMAEMVATEKKTAEIDTDSGDDRDDDPGDRDNSHTGGFSPEGVDSSNTFGDDMLQMALKLATGELDEPAVDLEAALTPNTITATQAPTQQDAAAIDNDVQADRLIGSVRGRKRIITYKPRSAPSKRGKRATGSTDLPLMPPPEPQPPPQPRIIEPIEKPDANMALKYTFGVNAWKQWVIAKNIDLEKQSTPMRKLKLFKTDLLQLTADELNYSLCLFVKEVRKPNGSEYAPDTIYYLCLGIQQYLFENNRIDNIFTDPYYEKFTDCLNDVAKKFSVLYNDAQYIVTRVEEEHLWECKQLGAHSPHVLLSTLMFFNTKHFNLVNVEEHMQLSFSHIMKHWKRNPATQPTTVSGKLPGSRNVLLRFYPPQSALEGNSRKRKVYEQQENEENPLRCPVKLYEFYLSKCPESVKTRNDVFYLLPERSCVPDSPVWYSTSPLAKENLIKMLHRIKMVKEINVALLTS